MIKYLEFRIAQDITTNLRALYLLNNNVQDSKATYHGTASAGITYVEDRFN